MICHASEKWRKFIEAVRKGHTLYVHPDTWETLPDEMKKSVRKNPMIPKDEICAIDLNQYNPYKPIWTPEP